MVVDKQAPAEEQTKEVETLKLKELTIFEVAALGSVDDLKQRLKKAPSSFDINALDEDGFTLLMIAAKLKYSGLTSLLLEEGADINVKGTRDMTALLVACQHADIATITMLLEEDRKVDLEATDSNGNNALMHAAMCGSFQTAEMLIKAGTQPNATNQNKGTALLLGVLYGKGNVVEYLLNSGADVNAQDTHGNTALHYAATLGYANLVKLLMKNGGKANIQNEKNMVAAQLTDISNITKLLQTE